MNNTQMLDHMLLDPIPHINKCNTQLTYTCYRNGYKKFVGSIEKEVR